MESVSDMERGAVVLGEQIIARDITYKDYAEHYAGQSARWVGRQPFFPFEGEVIGLNVPYEKFLSDYDEQRVEWINGTVIRMTPATPEHAEITGFLQNLFSFYLSFAGGGRVYTDVVIVRFEQGGKGRAPDVIVILPPNLKIVQEKDILGAPDLVVEVVSADSQRRDRVEKFLEYEQGGIKEYWIIDPLLRDTLFFTLGDDRQYHLIAPDDDGSVRSTVLSKLILPAGLFWRQPLPDGVETFRMVETLFTTE